LSFAGRQRFSPAQWKRRCSCPLAPVKWIACRRNHVRSQQQASSLREQWLLTRISSSTCKASPAWVASCPSRKCSASTRCTCTAESWHLRATTSSFSSQQTLAAPYSARCPKRQPIPEASFISGSTNSWRIGNSCARHSSPRLARCHCLSRSPRRARRPSRRAVSRQHRQAGQSRVAGECRSQPSPVRTLRSNPSIERTSQRPLRALCAAAHVER
jgi:hypothetical protein